MLQEQSGCLAFLCSSKTTLRPSNFCTEVKPADIEVSQSMEHPDTTKHPSSVYCRGKTC